MMSLPCCEDRERYEPRPPLCNVGVCFCCLNTHYIRRNFAMAPKLLVIGGGFAGVFAAKGAKTQGFDVTLIDKKARESQISAPRRFETRSRFALSLSLRTFSTSSTPLSEPASSQR